MFTLTISSESAETLFKAEALLADLPDLKIIECEELRKIRALQVLLDKKIAASLEAAEAIRHGEHIGTTLKE